jgi:transcriptional regulator with XRE-family HTH domain
VGSSREPSPARKHVGRLIKSFRKRAGLTQKQLAELVLVSESLEGAYERAERIPTTDFLLDADKVMDAQGALASCVEMMEEEKYPPDFLDWKKLQDDAVTINGYETMLIPGLLQTEDYTRALYKSRVPVMDEDEIQRHVDARMERQSVLARKPTPLVSYVVEESALQRPISSTTVLKEALWHIQECIRALEHLTVQVMPTNRQAHAGLLGPMHLLSTPEGRNLVYVESYGGSRLISKPQEVNMHLQRYGEIRAQALAPGESVELIERLAGEL